MKGIYADRAALIEAMKDYMGEWAENYDLEQMAFDLEETVTRQEAVDMIEREEAVWTSIAVMMGPLLVAADIPDDEDGWEPYLIK